MTAAVHLPASVANELTAVGWPQMALPVIKTRAVLISPPMTAADREHERLRVARHRARVRKMQQRCRDELRALMGKP
jgi:hypothetical protein